MAPKSSVCIPTYNYAHYISFAVESILSQQFTDFELIIVDDSSQDNTEEVVSRFGDDKRVLFEKMNVTLASWPIGTSVLRGERRIHKVLFLDGDAAFRRSFGTNGEYSGIGSLSVSVASARHLIDHNPESQDLHHIFLRIYGRWAGGHQPLLSGERNLIGEPTVVTFRGQIA